jgi:hypothetical protein
MNQPRETRRVPAGDQAFTTAAGGQIGGPALSQEEAQAAAERGYAGVAGEAQSSLSPEAQRYLTEQYHLHATAARP